MAVYCFDESVCAPAPTRDRELERTGLTERSPGMAPRRRRAGADRNARCGAAALRGHYAAQCREPAASVCGVLLSSSQLLLCTRPCCWDSDSVELIRLLTHYSDRTLGFCLTFCARRAF